MTGKLVRRRSALAGRHRGTPRGEAVLDHLCRAIYEGQLIPVIGDTIRISHIFDVDFDADIGLDHEDEAEQGALDIKEDSEGSAGKTVIEELADVWAEDIGYPLKDRDRIARVAQFRVVDKKDPLMAKMDFLNFLKHTLLNVAADVAELEDDPEGIDLVARLRRERTLTFADIVDELDFPRFPKGKEDPLRILARLPLKIYVTTGYYDFVERALIAQNKTPRSRLFLWNMKPEDLQPEHRVDPDYDPDADHPVVYHLLGMEQYPESLVLSEDDYLDFLWKMAHDRDPPDDKGESIKHIIPPYLEAELNQSSLLLLGYRLQDWDFRVLFRGLLNANPDASTGRRVGVAIQIDPREQPLVQDEEKTKTYLDRYFDKARLRVHWGDSDDFVATLWDEWQDWLGIREAEHDADTI